jgi:hypothetical protein
MRMKNEGIRGERTSGREAYQHTPRKWRQACALAMPDAADGGFLIEAYRLFFYYLINLVSFMRIFFK